MIPYEYQEQLSYDALEILREHAIVYLAMEERTGKTLTAILVAEQAYVERVLVITKKKALDGWYEHMEQFKPLKNYIITNYHQAHKIEGDFDLVILDEAHNYISGYPKPSKLWSTVASVTKGKPIIYISATPYAQGPQLLYHQFKLSSWSPWKEYKNFYSWFNAYGVPKTIWLYGKQVQQYDTVQTEDVMRCCRHLFISYTRRELGFVHEPVDKLHFINLSDRTKELYNELVKEQLAILDTESYTGELVCDTSSKLRTSLHMLEGGVFKTDDLYGQLHWEHSKIDYIKEVWGDTADIAIMYQYIEEGNKLRAAFNRATVLQATSYAEGVDLSHIRHLIIYSQDFSTARHTQRRARQANRKRDNDIVVHYLLVKDAISEQVYNTVSVNKQNFVDSVFDRTTI